MSEPDSRRCRSCGDAWLHARGLPTPKRPPVYIEQDFEPLTPAAGAAVLATLEAEQLGLDARVVSSAPGLDARDQE
jgi:hypothetical protein